MQRRGFFQKLGAFLSTIAVCLMISAPVHADTSSKMDGFFNGSLGTANVTGPRAYQGQAANYYSAGSLSYRTPQQTVNLASVQLPSLKAGCGGIDGFAGGFSFINSAQLVALAKAIVSNAIGFAFHAAINYLMPSVGKVLEHLQKIAQDINSRSINSCQLAQSIDNTIFAKVSSAITSSCINSQTANGTVSDAAQGADSCKTNAPNQAKQNSGSQQTIVDSNFTYNAIKKIPYLASDEQLANLVMNMVGTVIVDCEDNSDPNTCNYEYKVPEKASAILELFRKGGTYSGYSCPPGAWSSTSDDACNSVVDSTIVVSQGFEDKVDVTIQKLLADYSNRQVPGVQEQQLLGMTSLPLYKLIRTMVNAEGSNFASQDLGDMKAMIAAQLSFAFVDEAIHEAELGASRDIAFDEDAKKKWRDNNRDLVSLLHVQESTFYQEIQAKNAIVSRIVAMEGNMAQSASTRFASAARFTALMAGH